MTHYKWNHEKNEKLKADRGLGFEQIILHIERGDLIDVVEHPNQFKYPNQQMLVVKINDYVYLVPFVEDEEGKFLGHRTFVWVTPICCGHALMIENAAGFLLG
jgi:hypothetical protein